MQRIDANRQLVYLLSALIEQNPEQRFSQILRNYEFIAEEFVQLSEDGGAPWSANMWSNEFSAEGADVLKRVLSSGSLPKDFATALKVLYGETNENQGIEDTNEGSPCTTGGCGSCPKSNCGDKDAGD